MGSLHDGWGVAFYQGADVALFREPAGAAESALVRFLEEDGPETSLAISHIRHATQGNVSLANTQPFTRELSTIALIEQVAHGLWRNVHTRRRDRRKGGARRGGAQPRQDRTMAQRLLLRTALMQRKQATSHLA